MNESDNFPTMPTSAIQSTGDNLPDLKTYGYQVYEKLSEHQDLGKISYLGLDIKSDRLVVIKEWRRLEPQVSSLDYVNYLPNIKRLQRLDHLNIPRYLNSFATPTGFCVVRDYQSGVSLAELGDLPPSDIRLILDGILNIFNYIHFLTPVIIHQNIKPENIIVNSESNLMIYLVDFGLHSVQDPYAIAGTPGFISPEQLFDQNLTAKSDLYSLGVSLICLLTGTATSKAHSLFDDRYHLQFQQLLPPNIDPELINALTKMVTISPEQQQLYQNNIAPEHQKSSTSTRQKVNINFDSIPEPKQKTKWLPWGIGLALLLGLGLLARQFLFPDDGELSPAQVAKNEEIAQKANFAVSDRGQLLKEKRCSNCNLTYQDFSKAELSGANIPKSDLTGANFSDANLTLAIFRDADLSGANFSKADLRQAAFYGAKLVGTNLAGANLSNAKLVYAKLKGAWLRDANLSNADLKFAEVQQVDLTRVNFTGADLSNADLSYANLSKAILIGAKLDGTNLTGATMPDGSIHP